MEFTCRIDQRQFLRAKRLASKTTFWSWLQRQLFLWITICFGMVFLVVLIIAVFFGSNPVTAPHSAQQGIQASIWSGAMIFAVLGFSIYMQLEHVWLRDRRLYKGDPLMHGEITVNLTSDSVSTDNSVGATSKTNWIAFEKWIDCNDLVLLILRSKSYIILDVSGLDYVQHAELCSILSAALPRK
jgi:hypothetical protein